ncbi:hypothetical protein M0802_012076 [Mischocyttarus mexicanus]|nr:hypothetical protein M0802_012076 [Mischocyttarus mexicanus]
MTYELMGLMNTIYQIISFLVFSIKVIIERIVKLFIPVKYQMKDISGEVALITGGGGGLGRLLALRLTKLRVIVVIWDINQESIDETVKLVRASGGTCYGYACDLCNPEDIYKKAALLKEEVGKTVKAFLPGMMESNKGHIVSIASMAGYAGIPRLVDYCTSKHAAVGFDEGLKIELEYNGYDNINTTAICPYFIHSTGMFDERYNGFLPTLSPNEVADQTITSLRCNHKVVMIPSYFHYLVALKWFFPWPCISRLYLSLVKDIVPPCEGDIKPLMNKNTREISSNAKNQDNDAIHQQLTRHISSSERKP